MPKLWFAGFGSRNGLEHEIDRRTTLDRAQRGGDMGEHAGLGGDCVTAAHGIEHGKQRDGRIDAVGCGVNADDSIPSTEQQTIERRRGDAVGIIGGMVRLQAHGQAAGQTDGVAEPSDDAAFGGNCDQILQAHQLAHGGRHLRGERPGLARSASPLSAASRNSRNSPTVSAATGAKAVEVVRVDDQPCHLVGLIWNDGLGEERRKRQIGHRHLCGDTFRGAPRSEPGECIT